MPDATSPYIALATANTQNAVDRRAAPSVASAVGAPDSIAELNSSSASVSGSDDTSSHAKGASPRTSAAPMAAHAVRHPRAPTRAPTAGNATMNPTLITTA